LVYKCGSECGVLLRVLKNSMLESGVKWLPMRVCGFFVRSIPTQRTLYRKLCRDSYNKVTIDSNMDDTIGTGTMTYNRKLWQ
jgi:hypothetical protein